MAVLGVPLHAMVQNLGQTNDGYRSVGGTNKVLSQGFTTGSHAGVYVLQGIGVNVEGSGGNVPDGPASVSVAVHADSGGKPGAKLFDLLSPTEYAAGHSFFEAPPGTTLEGSTSYVMVWSHLGGTVHRMRKTGSNSEDSGALTGFSMANTFYQGADLDNMAADPGSDVLGDRGVRQHRQPVPMPPAGRSVLAVRGRTPASWLCRHFGHWRTGSPMWAGGRLVLQRLLLPVDPGQTATLRPWWAPTRSTTGSAWRDLNDDRHPGHRR